MLLRLAGALVACVASAGAQVDVVSAHPRYVVYEAAADVPDVPDLWRTDQKTGKTLRLSEPPVPGGAIQKRTIDPKGRYVVYRGDLDTKDLSEVYRSSLKTGQQLKLSGPMDPAGYGAEAGSTLGVDPKGRFAVYVAEQDEAGVFELYRSRLSNGERLKLSGPMTAGGGVSSKFSFDPRGHYVLYLADQDTVGAFELYRSRLTTGEVLKLSGPLAPGHSVISGYELDPKGKYVVFSVRGPEPGYVMEVFKASLADGELVKLNGPLASGGGVISWRLHPQRHALTYVADQDADGVDELFWTDLKSGVNVKLNAPLVEGGDVSSWELDDKHDAVLYVADQDADEVFSLYRADLKTGGVEKLSGDVPLVSQAAMLDPAGRYSVYLSLASNEGPWQFWRTDLDDGSQLDVTGPLVEGGDVEFGGGDIHYPFEIVGGRFLLFAADADTQGITELYRADLSTGERLKLNPPLPDGVSAQPFKLDPTGRFIVFSTMGPPSESMDYIRCDVETGESLVLATLHHLGDPTSTWAFDPKGRFLYTTGDFETPETWELFRFDLQTGERVKLNGPLVPGGAVYG